MKKVMFICHGNICRSPMAEFLFADIITKRGLDGAFSVASSAVSSEEIGNPVYPPVKRLLSQMGIDCSKKRARKLTEADGENYDYLLCMDESNLVRAKRIVGVKNEAKCKLLLSYTGEDRGISDPWYTGDFEAAYQDIDASCRAILRQLRSGL